MKKMTFSVLGLMLALGLAFNLVAYAADDAAGVIAEHKKMAASYQEKAAAQNSLIAEHTQMLKDYKAQHNLNPKFSPPADVEKMDKHCNAIIKDAEKLKGDFQEFAKWHEMRAAELQGQ